MKTTDELRAATQAGLVDFLRADLEICSTFAEVAKTEASSDRQHAQEAIRRAERGCEVIGQFVMRIQGATQRQEIELELSLLQCRLTAIKGELGFD